MQTQIQAAGWRDNASFGTAKAVALLDFLRCLRIKSAKQKIIMFHLSFSRLLGAVAIAFLFFNAGCGEEDARFSAKTQYLGGVHGGAPAGAPRDTVSYWDGDSVQGKPSITIHLGEQRAYFYKSGVLVGVSQLSTGREGLNTPYGHFSIIQKDVNHASSLFGDYVDSAGNVVVPNVDVTKDRKPPGSHFRGTPMPYFMRIVSGTGLHAGYLPGYPASHGCIRMPEFMAENFFKSVSLGTPVTITN
jgi:lipoprotein-anchoring transpeptidase ErfK/SrfK